MKYIVNAGLVSGLLAVSSMTYAGEAVYGYGETRSAAAAEATRKAEKQSAERFQRSDCITPVKPESCKKDDGGWVCVAYVANHPGSCG